MKGLTEPDWNRVAVGRGPAKFYKSNNPQTQSKIRYDINASLLTNHRFQRGSRIIVIGKVFATPKSIAGGPSLTLCDFAFDLDACVTLLFATNSVARGYLIT